MKISAKLRLVSSEQLHAKPIGSDQTLPEKFQLSRDESNGIVSQCRSKTGQPIGQVGCPPGDGNSRE